MRTLPKSRDGFFAWADAHVEAFEQHAQALGLTVGEVAQYVEALSEAHAADLAQRQAMLAAQAATLAAKVAEERSRVLAARALATIRLTAAKSGDRSVYTLAMIAPPKQASPLPQPGTPYKLEASLRVGGALELTWEADHPAGSSGVTYTVLRQLPGEASFALLATTGEKKYVDTTLPRAVDGVMYAVQSQRGRKLGGRSFAIEVNFGSIANPRASAVRAVA